MWGIPCLINTLSGENKAYQQDIMMLYKARGHPGGGGRR